MQWERWGCDLSTGALVDRSTGSRIMLSSSTPALSAHCVHSIPPATLLLCSVPYIVVCNFFVVAPFWKQLRNVPIALVILDFCVPVIFNVCSVCVAKL